ncbi:Phosphatidylinositol phosphatase PTPRQ [Araneus ventricosus]|uniref:protein-tyrosine-phosphatase n=1 Tax=Araneus ventricosus TaxID=182803 RepID=A0A4Y2BUR3_ARAVE|nr:Phosphatidylinositol phosphatase PTPRQ [Araneus ventricosus]
MAGTAVLLLCVFLGLTDTTTAQLTDTTTAQIIDATPGQISETTTGQISETTTDEPSTLPTTTLLPDDPCFADWTISVDKNFTVRWDGADREATIFVNIVPIETYGEECLKKEDSTASFREKEAPPIIEPPCFNSVYQVDVQLRCGENNENVAHKYSTRVWTEPDAPSNVRVTFVTSSSFRVTWDKPPGTIEEYKVKVDSVEATTTVTYRDVKNLEPVTEYKIQVSAKNSREWGKWSEEITIETKKIELPTPQNLRNLSVTNTTIEAAWDKVKFEDYQIGYCLRFGLGSKEKGLNTTGTSFTIKWLNPYTKYFIRVRAFTVGATGNWTETLAVTTLPGVPSEPEDVTEIEVDSVSIKIRWKEPSPSTGPIKFYTVEWTESLNSMKAQQAVTNTTFYTIKNLIPLTSYEISVSAATDAGLGNWTPAIQVKTEDPVPPENFRKASTSSNSISVEWDEPKIYKGRGIMVAYSVRWNRLSFPNRITPNTTNLSMAIDGLEPKTKYMFEVQGWTEKGSSAWSPRLVLETEVGVPDPPVKVYKEKVSNTSIEVKWEISGRYKNLVTFHTVECSKMDNGDTRTVNTTKLSHIIEDLEAYTKYSIRVKSWTVDGSGEWSDSLVVQTAIGVPLIPKNIKEDEVTNASILVTWNEPLPVRGPIKMYSIKWQREGSAKSLQNYTDVPSYLIEELIPYQNYSIQVSAKTQAGFGDWSDPITVQTNVGIPFKPRNIKGDEVTNTSIFVKWNEPSPVRGPIEMYFIEWQEEGSAKWEQKSTVVPSYLIEELTPCRKYFIRVSAKTEAGLGNWTDPITVSTTTGLPMVPKNVKISSSKTESLEIRWEEPEPHLGNIVSYSIRWGKRGRDLQFNDVTNGTFYIIGNLSAYTWYSVQVRATTEAGDGEWSKPVEGRTDIGIPSLPRDFQEKTNRTTNTSIEIEWEEPIPANGPITNYTVNWTNLDSNLMESSITRETTYVIKQLVPYTNYSVQVRAATMAGFGNWTDALVIRTETGVPFKPRNVKSVTVKETSILLKWEEPEPMVGYITHYDVEWTDASTNSTVTEKPQNLYYMITNLSAYTNYTIRIRAATCAGSGDWSDPILVRTLSGVPLPPKNLEEGEVTNLTICIKWKEPSPFKGPILLYTVRWRHAISKKVSTASTETSSYCIQKLEPYTSYEIDVQAKTAAGFGAWSESKKIQTAVGIPTAVKHVESHNKTAWTIYLTWSPPDPANGLLQDYEVKWGEYFKPEAMRNLTKDTFFVAENLTPFTNYTFMVSASTKVGFGPPSDSFMDQTEIAEPSAPVNLWLVSATNISIMLKWKQPVAPNGPILGYTVLWKTTYGAGSPQVAEVQSILQHNVTGLLPYESYSIQVSAKTIAGSGPWSNTLMANTKIGVPKPAQVLSISVESSKTISVEWSTTNPYPGPTTYEVQVWRKPSHCNPGSDAILETSIDGPRGSGEWRFTKPETIEGLTPYSEYFVRVLLRTSVGGSTSSDSSVVKTPPDSPGAPRKVEAECKESTETVVRWKSPLYPNGKIIEYLVRYGVEYSGWSEEAVFVEDECQENHSLRLTDLRPERKYKIYVRAKADEVEENGAEASIKGYCVLPAGIPPVGDIKSVTIHGTGPHTLGLEWNKNIFFDTMGDIIHYAVIVGVSEAVGNATNGRIAETFPSWSNYSGGLTSFYQATPLEWNPFDEEQEDPLHCEEIKAEEPERKTFIRCTIGVDKECSSAKPYCNGPLKPDTRYGVKLRAFTRGGFSETDPLYTITDPIKEPSSIVGVIVGVIIVLLMLSAFIVFTLILKRKGKLVELRLAILGRFGRQPTAPQLPAEQVLQLEACPAVVPLTIRNFADHVRLMMSDSHLRFSQEFETLKKNSPKYPCSTAEMDENRPKNRWLNIFPYDHSRVKLLPLGDEPGSDFVNANYVPGYSSLREYIATQGPLANTVDDFWRMIWEQSVSMIVMLTQCVERGKNKCEQYWPDAGEAKHYGDMQVRTISESMLSSYIIRLFHVQLGSQERRVKQMHFTHWPDFGCPESPDDLINFIRAVRDHLPRFKPGPIVVHCSAGVGRTGTFMAVDRLSQQLRSTDTIDIFGTVMELRHHRINMVQTEDQYIYIHLCVKQLVDDINQPHESEYEEAIYSNIGMEKDTGV